MFEKKEFPCVGMRTMKKWIIILAAVFVLAVCGVGASYASELTDLSTWTYDSTQETWVPDPSSYNFSAIFSSGGGHNWETILYVQANGDTTAQVAIAVAGFTEDPSDMQEFGFQTERGPFTEVSNLSIGGTFYYEPKYNLDGFFYERQMTIRRISLDQVRLMLQ